MGFNIHTKEQQMDKCTKTGVLVHRTEFIESGRFEWEGTWNFGGRKWTPGGGFGVRICMLITMSSSIVNQQYCGQCLTWTLSTAKYSSDCLSPIAQGPKNCLFYPLLS